MNEQVTSPDMPDSPNKLPVPSQVESKKPTLKSPCTKSIVQENGRNRPVAPKPDPRHTTCTMNSKNIDDSAFKINGSLPVKKIDDTNGIKNTQNDTTKAIQIQPATVKEMQPIPSTSVKRQTVPKSSPHFLPPPTQVSTPLKTLQQLQPNSASSIKLSLSTDTTSTTEQIYSSCVPSSTTSPIMASTTQQVLDCHMNRDSDANFEDEPEQSLQRIVNAIVAPVDLWKNTADLCSCANPLSCKCLGQQCEFSSTSTTSTFPAERTSGVSSQCQCYKSPNTSSIYSDFSTTTEKTRGSFSPDQCDKSSSSSSMYSEVETDNSTKGHEQATGGQIIPICSKDPSASKSMPKGSTTVPGENHYQLSNTMPFVSEPPSRHRPHHCSECSVSFKRADSFQQHQEMHANDKLQKSKLSKSNTTSSNSSKPDNLLYKCNMDKCDLAFPTIRGLRNHQRMHLIAKEVKRYKCPFCPLTFKYTGDVKRHARRHTGQKPYICGYCSMRFSQLTTLRNHERTHTGERPYKCPKCDKAYTQSGTRRYHIAIMHPEILSNGRFTKRKSAAAKGVKESGNDATRASSKLSKSLAAKSTQESPTDETTQESVTVSASDEVNDYDEEQIV